MLDWLFLALLYLQVGLMVLGERKLFDTWITPITVVAIPYLGVVTLAGLFSVTLGFYPFFPPSTGMWIVGLLFFGLSGWAVAFPFMHGRPRRTIKRRPFRFELFAQRWALLLLWIIIPAVGIRLLTLLNSMGGLSALASDAFARQYGSGLFAHLLVFGYPLLILLIGTVRRRQYLVLLTIFVTLALVFVYQVKSWIIVPVVAGMIYRWLSGRLQITPRFFALMALLMTALFFGSYLVTFGARNPALLLQWTTYQFLFGHLTHYLFAGVMALSEYVRASISVEPSAARVFAPFINLYSVLAGQVRTSPINELFVPISIDGRTSNVFTLFGSLYITLGWLGGMLYTAAMGVLVYAVYLVVRLNRNCWFAVLWVYWAGMLAVGWFEFYFWNLAALEASVYCVLLGVAFSLISIGSKVGEGESSTVRPIALR